MSIRPRRWPPTRPASGPARQSFGRPRADRPARTELAHRTTPVRVRGRRWRVGRPSGAGYEPGTLVAVLDAGPRVHAIAQRRGAEERQDEDDQGGDHEAGHD